MHIINSRKIWYSLSGVVVVASLILFFTVGLKFGIDFTGGSLMEISFHEERPETQAFRESMQSLELDGLQIAESGDKGFIMRFSSVTEDQHQDILNHIKQTYPKELTQEEIDAQFEDKGIKFEVDDAQEGTFKSELNIVDSSIATFDEERFESIGPIIGEELKQKSLWAIFYVLAAIILYVAWAFRKVSRPISSVHYGIITVFTLFHDIIITVGIFVLLGMFAGVEVNTPFVAALLTILGYSVNDTIVVFDRIRENVMRREGTFADIIDKSVKQTMVRSINTSVTTLLALLAVYFFGGATLQSFVLALIIGILLGTYSSIFIAAPLLVTVVKWMQKRSKA